MKHLIVVLLCLLLCGCSRDNPPAQPETEPDIALSPVMAGLYDPDHLMEKQYPGLVRAYPLVSHQAQGIRTLGKDLLLLSGMSHTTLTVFTGDTLLETASLTLDFPLQADDPSLQIHEHGISYFDPVRQETIVLDHRLQEVRRIAAPLGLSGKPLYSNKEETLYYCTGWSVAAWDLSSGIRRTVKELSYESQELTGIYPDYRILECSIRDREVTTKLLLTADQGLQIHALPEESALQTQNHRYFAALSRGFQTLLIFGNTDTEPELLLPAGTWDQQFYLPEDHAAVTTSVSEKGLRLDYYELNTGILRSSLRLESSPKSIANSKDHSIYILSYDSGADCDILYRWDVLRQPPDPDNFTSHAAVYPGTESPDPEAMEACREYADSIGETYGITVRIGADAVEVQPWDYQFEPDYLAPVLQKELTLLDKRLAQYPEAVLQKTKAHFSGLTICLVQSITGTGDPGSLSNATGIQFFQDNHAYVVITTGKYSEQALYHELFHVMETHILTESTALDQWETLNPGDFMYDSKPQNAKIYLTGQTRAFVDRYSMVYPKEDRARILENAMLPGKKDLFQSEYMQRKLHAICLGIREAYRLKTYPQPLPWEQYLINPLTTNP